MTLFDPPGDGAPPYVPCACGMPWVLGTVHRVADPCFVYEEPDLDHLKFQRHSTTSRSAALDSYPRKGTQRARVLDHLRQMRDGCTDEEIGLALQMNPSSVRPRRIELVEGGWVVAKLDAHGLAEDRPTRSGSKSQVWTASRMAHVRTGEQP